MKVPKYKKCSSYRTRTIKRHLSEYDKGFYAALHDGAYVEYVEEEQSYCIGTKECETCTCDGDRSKCNFYPQNKFNENKEKEIQEIANKIQDILDSFSVYRKNNEKK